VGSKTPVTEVVLFTQSGRSDRLLCETKEVI
jgi:hypothetical protein